MPEPVFTPEQLAELGSIVNAAVEKAFNEQKESAEAKAQDEKDRQKAIDDAVAAKLADEREKAVKEYKEKEKLGASRADEVSEIVPYESEEAKAEAIEKLAEMSQEEYEAYKADKEKDKKIAELEAKVKGDETEEDKHEGDLNASKGEDKDKPAAPTFRRF